MKFDAIVETVRMSGVSKRYLRAGHPVSVLDQLDFSLDGGSSVAVMGPSGSGKTTLLNMISGLDTPDAGSVVVCGKQIHDANNAQRADYRSRCLGIVFQQASLLPELTVRRNVEVPLLLWPLSSAEARRRADLALDLVGMSGYERQMPHQLSGGQEQRVAIARAMVTDPPLLVCDEPTASLDSNSAQDILLLLRTLCGSLGKSLILVTHDHKVKDFVDRTLILESGRLAEATPHR